MDKKYWYAVMYDNDDNDWGSGSYDRPEAEAQVAALRANGHPEAHIAVIDEGYPDEPADPICVEIIR